MPIEQLVDLIKVVNHALTSLNQPEPEPDTTVVSLTPAQIRNSITPESLISFVDGRPYKTLKRHLATNGLTIAEYKERFGLPKDYPVTAPSYSAKRSQMAKSAGPGRSAAAAAVTAEPAPKPKPSRKAI